VGTNHNPQTFNDRGENPAAGCHPSSDIYLDDITVSLSYPKSVAMKANSTS